MALAPTQARTCGNYLLSMLREEEYEELLPSLEFVETKVKDVASRQGELIEHAYFPCSSALSCLLYMEDGASIEVGTIGNESFASVELLFGADIAIETVICQIPGHNLRMTADNFRKMVGAHAAFRQLIQRSAQVYLAQVSQSVACNRLHSVDMRFARWLLITHDRVRGDEFPLTQEFLASMLGVHRPSVSLVAGIFQQAGIIRYSRGKVHILDRARLEEASCECYSVVRKQFKRLLEGPE